MNSGVNWPRLYEQGRCKSIGIPWTEEEAKAVSILKIPAEYVRQGCLTQEDYEKAKDKREMTEKKTGKVALVNMKRDDLVSLCAKYGIVTTDEATRPALIETLLQAGAPKSVSADELV